MIGQENVLQRIDDLLDKKCLPHFVILTGTKGSGKKLLAEHISDKVATFNQTTDDVTISSVRTIIQDSYKHKESFCYVLQDVDAMSVAAKNALLKVTEEPPNNAYFLMTIEDINNTLDTIRSRATVFQTDPYTPEQILEFYWSLEGKLFPHGNTNDAELIQEFCTTPGEVLLLCSQHPTEFVEYVRLVSDNISKVSGSNAFKIPSKVALKDGDEGYDIKLFWKIFQKVCLDQRLYSGVIITSKYLKDLRIRGVNRQMLMDNWILDIREAWREEDGD